ncbi:phosphopantetheine adenylyltransferase [Roseibium porphyridii]|uniref:Phosphopantetheine adenylyltransferase n=1 Tax=Roseibium porphyridii TaxID=2866279 RepID=A0ABY8F498_9HYPH|nr:MULTISPECIES: phosphopantetheine adenylyltransferase [Stappiaceae]QFT32182.1 hypothetical protein FIV00_16950 [Labrenzia sp. THAF82]WFE87558.1 phosphopantetheine adenylyltransferase [Roseibium sp. KMA01]
MRSYETIDRTADQTAAKSFIIQAKAVDPVANFKMVAIFTLALLTMIAAGVMTMHPSNASQAQDLNSLATQGMMATKGDRAAISQTANGCETQAWGAWTEDCAAALTGASKVRNVSFVTVEKQTPSVNETILARYPTAN